MTDAAKFVSVDQLPDDPLAMPPPYWRSGGASFQLDDALQTLIERLHELVPIHSVVRGHIARHFERYTTDEETEAEAAMDEFGDICDPLWEAEHRVKLKADLSILMAAILAEEIINRFCVYNVPKELVEALEKLSPAEKLTAAASHLGKTSVRSSAAFAAITALSSWRNAFAHGHCVDRPVKTLRHNHLISPDEYPGVPDTVAAVIKHIAGLVRIVQFLAAIGLNPFTANTYEATALPPYVGGAQAISFYGQPRCLPY